ncbi:MAG: hypothetical protein COA78_27435 [Blastopirellula sp.]|nr:MAG: hypothetical protein COA78_27435 [Blastopirellula sp.]
MKTQKSYGRKKQGENVAFHSYRFFISSCAKSESRLASLMMLDLRSKFHDPILITGSPYVNSSGNLVLLIYLIQQLEC